MGAEAQKVLELEQHMIALEEQLEKKEEECSLHVEVIAMQQRQNSQLSKRLAAFTASTARGAQALARVAATTATATTSKTELEAGADSEAYANKRAEGKRKLVQMLTAKAHSKAAPTTRTATPVATRLAAVATRLQAVVSGASASKNASTSVSASDEETDEFSVYASDDSCLGEHYADSVSDSDFDSDGGNDEGVRSGNMKVMPVDENGEHLDRGFAAATAATASAKTAVLVSTAGKLSFVDSEKSWDELKVEMTGGISNACGGGGSSNMGVEGGDDGTEEEDEEEDDEEEQEE